MPIVRCTCVYRPAHLTERDEGELLVVELADPFCPAEATHARMPRPRTGS